MRRLVHDIFVNIDNGSQVNDFDDPNPPQHGPDPETQAFYDLLREADVPLWKRILDCSPGAQLMQPKDIALSTPEATILGLNAWIKRHKIVESW